MQLFKYIFFRVLIGVNNTFKPIFNTPTGISYAIHLMVAKLASCIVTSAEIPRLRYKQDCHEP